MQVICTACGRRNDEQARFCEECGVYLPPDLPRVAPIEDWQPQPAAGTSAGAGGDGAALATETTETDSPPVTAVDGRTQTPTRVCPQCGTPNDTTLRFCRRCGHQLDEPARTTTQPLPQRASARQDSWWRRVVPSWTPDATKPARSSYRRSLPVRYNLLRYGSLILLVGVVVVLVVWGGQLWGWAKGTYADVFDKTTVISADDLTAVTVPAVTPDSAHAAIDGDTNSWWSTPWRKPGQAATNQCQPNAEGTGSLRLTVKSGPVELRAIDVTAFRTKNPDQELIPKELQLSFPGQNCQTVHVDNDLKEHVLDIDGVTTSSVTVSVVAVYSPDGKVNPNVSITEIALLKRRY